MGIGKSLVRIYDAHYLDIRLDHITVAAIRVILASLAASSIHSARELAMTKKLHPRPYANGDSSVTACRKIIVAETPVLSKLEQ
jgi:hypothetical protein